MKPRSKARAGKPLPRMLKASVGPRIPMTSSPAAGAAISSAVSFATATPTSSSTMRGGHVPAPATPRVKVKALYLFSGEPRDNDLTMEIVRTGHAMGLEFEVTEVDICQGPQADLRHPAAWSMILDQISAKEYIIIFMSPPCNTFSRALFNALIAGPLPLRTFQHPKGFPWLSGVKKGKHSSS